MLFSFTAESKKNFLLDSSKSGVKNSASWRMQLTTGDWRQIVKTFRTVYERAVEVLIN